MTKDNKYSFFESYHNALARVSDERYGRVVRAMSSFVFKQEEPNFTDDADWIVWELIRPILERGMEISKSRADAGANGGRKGKGVSRNKGNRNAAKDTPESNSKQKQINSKQKQINSGIGIGEGIGEEIIDSSLHSESSSSCDDSQSGNADLVLVADDGEKAESVDFQRLMDFFNKTMKEKGAQIHPIREMTKRRKQAVNARIKEHGKQALITVIVKAAESTFLNGGSDRPFLADFSWLMKPENFLKTLEGKYDDRQNALANLTSTEGMFQSSDAAVQRAYNIEIARELGREDAKKMAETRRKMEVVNMMNNMLAKNHQESEEVTNIWE